MRTFNGLCRKAITVAFICLYNPIAAQYNFDTLYKHDPAFKAIVKNIVDTLDIYAYDEPLKITIESDFKSLYKNKMKDEYQKAILRFDFNDTIEVSRKIKIKPRGGIRKEVCYYPPLKLNFPKKETKLEYIKEFDKMKMVVQCKQGPEFERYLLAEYMVYKLYNLLSKYSLRVRLLKVRYVDTGSKRKPMESYAFIIEDIDQLAQRINGVKLERKNVRDPYLFRDQSTVVFLFEYFIGNTDWSIPALHNIKLIKPMDQTINKVYVIPYDFDYSGIVNASYAVVPEELGIEDVRQRLYRGYCRTPEELHKAIGIFKEKKEAIYALYNQSKLFDKSYIKSTVKYIDEFYQIVDSKYGFKNKILNACLK